MRFTQSVDLALHALWFMARNAPDQPVMIKDLAKSVRASESYLARVMLWLTKAGLLRSIRGKKGGFVFKIPPSQITIADVVIAIDTDAAEFSCPWEERGCQRHFDCALVDLFHQAQQQMLNVLRRMTIEDIAATQSVGTCNSDWLTPSSNGLKALNESTASVSISTVANSERR